MSGAACVQGPQCIRRAVHRKRIETRNPATRHREPGSRYALPHAAPEDRRILPRAKRYRRSLCEPNRPWAHCASLGCVRSSCGQSSPSHLVPQVSRPATLRASLMTSTCMPNVIGGNMWRKVIRQFLSVTREYWLTVSSPSGSDSSIPTMEKGKKGAASASGTAPTVWPLGHMKCSASAVQRCKARPRPGYLSFPKSTSHGLILIRSPSTSSRKATKPTMGKVRSSTHAGWTPSDRKSQMARTVFSSRIDASTDT